MPLILDANDNITANDTGTYTWSDIVALNSSKLDKYGDINKPIYRWRGIIDAVNATINIQNVTIELYGVSTSAPGIIRTSGNGSIVFGFKETINSIDYCKYGCNIIITRFFYSTSQEDTLYAPLSFSNTGRLVVSGTGGNVRIYGSRIHLNTLNFISTTQKIIVIFISELINSTVNSEDIFTSANPNFISICYFKKQSIIKNSKIHSVCPELLGSATVQNLDTYSTSSGINAYIGFFLGLVRLEVSSLLATSVESDYYVDNRTAFDFINCPTLNLANGLIENTQNTNISTIENRKLFTHNLKIIDSNGAVNNCLVSYTGRTVSSAISSSTGDISQFKLINQETNYASVTPPTRYNRWSKPLPLINYFNYVREIKSYLHLAIKENILVTEQIGNDTQPFQYSLTIDSGITQINTTTVNSYAGISHTNNTITVNQLRTLNEIYDSRKLYWRNNTNINCPYLEGTTFNLNGTNLVIDGVTLVNNAKFKTITTSGSITYLNNGNSNFSTKDVNGFRFKIYGLPTKSNSLPVIRIKQISTNITINPTISNGEVYVYLIEGENYEIRADARGYIASNFITINTNTSSELQITLEELLDSNNNPIFGNGIQQQKDLITYDNITNTIFISYNSNYPTISLFSAIDKLEEILASTIGLELPMHPIYENGKLVFIRNIVTNAQSTIKIKPSTNNTGDPELLFELVREGDEKPYNLFDFSTSNGRTIKYPTTVNVATFDGSVTVDNNAVATAVWSNTTRTLTSSASLTPEQEAKLNNLDVAVSTRLAATSYTQAPTTTQIKTDIESSTVLAKEVTVASRASQASVNLIPTNTLLTTDNRLNNLDTSISSRLASSDYNEALTVTDIRTELSTELSRIDAPVSSRATSANVWTNSTRSLTEGVTVNTNNDKTDYSLSNNSIIAIWNTLITSLTTIGSIGKRIVDYLDTTISSRSSEDTVNTINTKVNTIPTNPLLTTDVRLNTLDANISTRLATSNYIVPLTANDITDLILNALNTKDVVTVNNLTTTKTELINAITLSGLTEEQSNKLNEISVTVLKLKKLRGLVTGVNVIAKAPTSNETGYLRTSDNDINLIITKNGDEEILSD